MQRATSDEVSTNKQKQRGASRKATQSTGPQHARRKEVRNEHDGTYKQSLTLGQGRICTGLQNALPKAVGGNLQGACNWTCNEAGSAGPTNQLLRQRTCAAGTVGRPTQVAKRSELPARSRTDPAVLTEYHRTGGATTLKTSLAVPTQSTPSSCVCRSLGTWWCSTTLANRSFPTRRTCDSPW